MMARYLSKIERELSVVIGRISSFKDVGERLDSFRIHCADRLVYIEIRTVTCRTGTWTAHVNLDEDLYLCGSSAAVTQRGSWIGT